MIPLLINLWPGLAGALALGIVVGVVTGWPRSRTVSLVLSGLALVLILLATAQAVPGVPGFWIEAAALMLPLYITGCAVGALGNRTNDAGR
ncbi:hypothetical protein [Methylobacterium aerolatum]|uniref:Peptidoglycan/LPS O-acetylase OafA/YrhL n=1 Tax=Methylobacterium aerolatum TaxID=418708 RepID=A0ABU0HTZ3_9HYPH|nr:hypothetical protein [Methylobacterium aerolatum]MDQ0445794.1 peptidoglycan/LPS O-acetylase OafA/YrhL [Methylobacterium aerolatum]GJD35945.1 hypothetical protein FMGBMHLM_2858 [Methylobacterium aerolatum]